MNDEEQVQIKKIRFNSQSDIELITKETSEVISSPNITEMNIVKKNNTIISNDEKIQLRIESPRRKFKIEKVDNNTVRQSFRNDFYGNIIKKGDKKYKVTFIDDVKKVNLKEIIFIENWKEYNIVEETKEFTKKNDCCGKCVII